MAILTYHELAVPSTRKTKLHARVAYGSAIKSDRFLIPSTCVGSDG